MMLTSLIPSDLLSVLSGPFPGKRGDHRHPSPVDPADAKNRRTRRRLGNVCRGNDRPDAGLPEKDWESLPEKFRD